MITTFLFLTEAFSPKATFKPTDLYLGTVTLDITIVVFIALVLTT